MNSSIDQKIIDKFRLFTGVRPMEEDKKIYRKVSSLLFDELLSFLEENLPNSDKAGLLDKLDSSKDTQKDIQTLSVYLAKIKNSKLRLTKRLDYFLNTLYFQTLAKK